MQMLISKETIIKAINEEELLAPFTFGDHGDPECPVCAVGAVFRKVHAPLTASNGLLFTTADDYDNSAAFHVADPLSQISSAFEFAFESCNMDGWPFEAAVEIARFHAMLIAEAFCPAQVEINIPVRKAAAR